jgi:hypothetical protein
MSKYIIPFTIIGILLFAGCNLNDDSDNFESDLEELTVMRTAIEELVDTSSCSDNMECLFIGFGSKPCGGPWSYLIYSTSIDTAQLEEMVELFNNKQAVFNTKYEQSSDCMAVLPPTSLICENGKCMSGS